MADIAVFVNGVSTNKKENQDKAQMVSWLLETTLYPAIY